MESRTSAKSGQDCIMTAGKAMGQDEQIKRNLACMINDPRVFAPDPVPVTGTIRSVSFTSCSFMTGLEIETMYQTA